MHSCSSFRRGDSLNDRAFRRWVVPLCVGLGATLAATALFWLTDLDLSLQALAYQPSEPHWARGYLPAWVFLYHYGTLPGLLLSVLAALGFGLSFVRTDFLRWRLPCLFLVLLLALGPGLLVNVIAKGLMGRPRPAQLVTFGGLLEFRRPFELGWTQKGFSFLCGHCSMGFMLMGVFFIVRRWTRWLWLVGGFALGLVQGLGRMLQGAHFASDAVLGGTVMFTLAAALSPLASIRPSVPAGFRPWWHAAGPTAGLIVLILSGFLLSVPVRDESHDVWLYAGQVSAVTTERSHLWLGPGRDPPAAIRLDLEVGDVYVEVKEQSEALRIDTLVTGFGFPGAGRSITIEETDVPRTVVFRLRLDGLFAERHGTVRTSAGASISTAIEISTRDGEVVLVGSFGGRPLVIDGRFELDDPAGRLSRSLAGKLTLAGEGAPVGLRITADKLIVPR